MYTWGKSTQNWSLLEISSISW